MGGTWPPRRQPHLSCRGVEKMLVWTEELSQLLFRSIRNGTCPGRGVSLYAKLACMCSAKL